MRVIYTFLFTSALFINSSECSSPPAGDPHGGRHTGPSSSFAGNLYLLAECSSQIDANPDCGNNAVRARSRSPSGTHASVTLLGYSLAQLGYIRLIPRTNESLQFEFRRYYFPVGKPIRLRADQNRIVPLPTREHIVLSRRNGDVSAILDDDGFLCAIYRADRSHRRVKINIISGEVYNLTADEMRDCPIGRNNPIFPRNYIKSFANENSLQTIWNPHSELQEPLSRSWTRTLPARPPSDRVFDRSIEQLGYVRLIPITNRNKKFEFRRYIFPIDEKIRIRIDHLSYSFEPNQAYIVVSTSDGDIFAIMDYDILRGIYRVDNTHSRTKMNMMSGEVINLTPHEIRDCPVGKSYPIFPKNFITTVADDDSLQSTWCSHGESQLSSSSSNRHSSPPGRPPSDKVLGYSLEKLGYIRLIPQANQNRRFEFRRYVIPVNNLIRLLVRHGVYVLVPNREHIVLSTSNGDVFAILEYTGILRGMYNRKRGYTRIKMNMISGSVHKMTEIELKECHVGERYPIFPRWFHEDVSNEDSLQHVYH